jgi:hypothetical protein
MQKTWSFPYTHTACVCVQVCNGLPETGVCDISTWRALATAIKSDASSVDELQEYLKVCCLLCSVFFVA